MAAVLDRVRQRQADRAQRPNQHQRDGEIDDHADYADEHWRARVLARVEGIDQQEIDRRKRQHRAVGKEDGRGASGVLWPEGATLEQHLNQRTIERRQQRQGWQHQ